MNAAPAAAAQGPVLRDIHVPPPPSWWPPAPGWWLLAIAAVALSIYAFLYFRRHYRRRRYRRAVLAELDRCIAAARSEPTELATSLSRFLRRIARLSQPDAGALLGDRWLEHLDRTAETTDFTQGVGRVLAEAPYRPAPDYDTAALIALVRRAVNVTIDTQAQHA